MNDFHSLAHAPVTLFIAGDGLWLQPGHPQKVQITRLCWGDMIEVLADEEEGGYGGELEVSIQNWDTSVHGLIYTDKGFLQGLRDWLRAQGIEDVESLEYTEQGMQGSEYVSLQASDKFARSIIAHTWA